IGRKGFRPTKCSKLCELHFTEDQFEPIILRKLGIKKLKCTAVLSIFSHRPAKLPRKPPHPRGTIHASAMPAACSSGPSVEGVPNAPAVENIPSCSELSSTTVCARELPPSLQSCSEETDIHTESSAKQARDDREETPSTGACVQNCISQPLSKKRQMDTPGSTTMPSTPICSRTFDGAGPQVESVWKEMETLKRKLAGCQK
ncbi:hypothetical protein V5799_034134, partial [Amblyomma americanum]